MEWVTGVKLTTLPAEEIRALVKVGQAAFLTQLLEIGLIHGDPHPGNLLKVSHTKLITCSRRVAQDHHSATFLATLGMFLHL